MAIGTTELIEEVTLGHQHQRPGRLLGVEIGRRDAGLYIARDAGRHRGDEAFDQTLPADPFHPGIVSLSVGDPA